MNRYLPSYFRVDITATGLGGAAPADGFIDDLRPEKYMQAGEAAPSNNDKSLAKERANIRWEEIIRQTGYVISPISITKIEKGGSPDGDTDATSISFTLGYDRVEYLSEDGLEGVDAIKRWVAKALTVNLNVGRDVYRPDAVVSDTGNVIQGSMIEKVEVGALAADIATAEDAITVTDITEV